MGSCLSNANDKGAEEEEEELLLEHQGEHYNMATLLSAVRTKTVVFVKPEDVLCDNAKNNEGILVVDEAEIARADYRLPAVLLSSSSAENAPPYTVLDGLPRVMRAQREQKQHIPARVVTADEMARYKQTL